MTFNKFLVRPLVAALAFALCGIPDALAQSPTTAAPPTGVSQDATQQPIQPSTTQQQNWPTQESAPNSATPAAPNATAPSTTAPGASAQQPAPTQPSTAPDASQRERVVLGPDGQPQPSSAQPIEAPRSIHRPGHSLQRPARHLLLRLQLLKSRRRHRIRHNRRPSRRSNFRPPNTSTRCCHLKKPIRFCGTRRCWRRSIMSRPSFAANAPTC